MPMRKLLQFNSLKSSTLALLFSSTLISGCSCVPGLTSSKPFGTLPPVPLPPSEIESQKLRDLFSSDDRLRLPELQGFLAALFSDNTLGRDLWQQALQESGSSKTPTLNAVLKIAVRPEWRPIFIHSLESSLKHRSELLKNALQNGTTRLPNRQPHYDVTVVGAGPNGSLAALKMRQTRPDLKIAMLESMPQTADVFRKFGLFTWLNSPETPGFTTNEFHGLPVGVKDLLPAGIFTNGPQGAFFVMSDLIQDLTTLSVFMSGADLYLGTSAHSISYETSPSSGVILSTTQGLKFQSDQILITSGFGRKPEFGIAENPLIHAPEQSNEEAPGIEHFDQLTERATAFIRKQRLTPTHLRSSFLDPYAGKRVAIIGAGDSGNNLAELTSGFGYPELYGKPAGPNSQPGIQFGPTIGEPGAPSEVLWIGQKFTDGETYKNHRDTKPRYKNTLPKAFASFHLGNERLEEVIPSTTWPNGNRIYTLVLKDRNTGIHRLIQTDYVWFATGYRLTSSPMIENLIASTDGYRLTEKEAKDYISTIEPIYGDIEVTTGPAKGSRVHTRIGRQVNPNLYLGGTVAGAICSEDELQKYTVTKNSASLNAHTIRAVALGKHLAEAHPIRLRQDWTRWTPNGNPPFKIRRGFPNGPRDSFVVMAPVTPRNGSFGRIVTDQPETLELRKNYQEVAIRTLLSESLIPYLLRSDVYLRFLTVQAGPSMQVEITTSGSGFSQTLGSAITKNRDLLKLIQLYSE